MRKKEVGCFVGKFLPPHIGHLSVINRMIKECKKIIVVLAEDKKISRKKCEESNFPYFEPSERLRWLKEYYKNHPNIKFYFFDEDGINPKDYFNWSKEFKIRIPEKITVKYADKSYYKLNKMFFPECEFVEVDRNLINIHGTDIRNNIENIKFVVPTGQKEILNKLERNKGKDYE